MFTAFGQTAKQARCFRHQQGRIHALARHIGDIKLNTSVGQRHDVVEITRHSARQNVDAVNWEIFG